MDIYKYVCYNTTNMTNTQTTFQIYRDGEPDPEFIHNQRVQAMEHMGTLAVKDVQRVGTVLLNKLGNITSEVFTPLVLDIHDAQHGSHLRDEWFERKHELATAAMRDEVGL